MVFVGTVLGVRSHVPFSALPMTNCRLDSSLTCSFVQQLSFGYLVDRYGRKFGMLAASAIMMCVLRSSLLLFGTKQADFPLRSVGSALCAGAYGAGGSITGMLQALIAWRFLTGGESQSPRSVFRHHSTLLAFLSVNGG